MVAEWRRSSTYIVGVVAAARSKVQIPENYEELSRKLLYSFPKRFQRVVTVANTYRWQAGERESCGCSDEKNRKNRNLVTMKRCFNTLKMLSYKRKLWYRLRNSMKFRDHIKMIQGTAISLSCDLKKNPLKKCYSSSQITEARSYDCQWLPWILDTPSARHTQETNSVRTVIDQQGEQTIAPKFLFFLFLSSLRPQLSLSPACHLQVSDIVTTLWNPLQKGYKCFLDNSS